jgi:hypothetical protein
MLNPPRRRAPLTVALLSALTLTTMPAEAQNQKPAKPAVAPQAPPPEPAPAVAAVTNAKYPTPAPPSNPDALGRGIQRTMTLLATSTPKKRNKVRILFYGQSITEQDWSKQVAADLRRRFPHADLEIENRAIGGFASQLLVRPAEHDLYPFYPDLLIFHVYGANGDYEQIIKNVRTRTAAEVLMQTDHANTWPVPDASPETNKGEWWNNFMNGTFLPQTAAKYGCGLVDVRSGWVEYMKGNHLEPPVLLKDGVHLNDHGNYVMAQLVGRYLVYRPDLAKGQDTAALARTYVVGKDVKWKNGRLDLPFDGNRVDLLAAPGKAGGGAARVLIDNQKPSADPAMYRITRPQPNPWASPVSLSRVDYEKPLVTEDWTLKVTESGPDAQLFRYEVTGSVTGPDGSGDSKTPFVSRSGRVKIDPAAFFFGFNKEKIPVGHTITWRALPMSVDTYAPPKADDPTREYPTTVAQGMTNGKHTLTLVADKPGTAPAIMAIRVYRPPVK